MLILEYYKNIICSNSKFEKIYNIDKLIENLNNLKEVIISSNLSIENKENNPNFISFFQ